MFATKKIIICLCLSILLTHCSAPAIWPFTSNDPKKKARNLKTQAMKYIYTYAHQPKKLNSFLGKLKNKNMQKILILDAIDYIKPKKIKDNKAFYAHKWRLIKLIKKYNELDGSFIQRHPKLTGAALFCTSGIAIVSSIIAYAAGKAFYDNNSNL